MEVSKTLFNLNKLRVAITNACNLSCFYVAFVLSERPFFHYN